MYFNRFDIVEAHYMYYTNYHGGMHTTEYARLSKILTYFTPSPLLRTEDDLEENSRMIYDSLVQENVCVHG